MNQIRKILERYKKGELGIEESLACLRNAILTIEDFAKIDINRETRTGIPEVILSDGKDEEQVLNIVSKTLGEKKKVIVSRAPSRLMESLAELPYSVRSYPEASMAVVEREGEGADPVSSDKKPRLAVISAGTADIPVAREAVVCAEEMGCEVLTSFDVGIAGICRLLPVMERINRRRVKVVVVAAGREGALPSVVGGLTDAIVIGLPVSTGYGFGGGGEAALMGMLQSCVPLLTVNIDAGVVAGMMGAKIANEIG